MSLVHLHQQEFNSNKGWLLWSFLLQHGHTATHNKPLALSQHPVTYKGCQWSGITFTLGNCHQFPSPQTLSSFLLGPIHQTHPKPFLPWAHLTEPFCVCCPPQTMTNIFSWRHRNQTSEHLCSFNDNFSHHYGPTFLLHNSAQPSYTSRTPAMDHQWRAARWRNHTAVATAAVHSALSLCLPSPPLSSRLWSDTPPLVPEPSLIPKEILLRSFCYLFVTTSFHWMSKEFTALMCFILPFSFCVICSNHFCLQLHAHFNPAGCEGWLFHIECLLKFISRQWWVTASCSSP